MREKKNHLYIKFPAVPENERLARTIAAAFISNLNPNLEELDDVKTAVSEAVTNCIIHAYEDGPREESVLDLNTEMEKGGEHSVEMLLDQEEQTVFVTIIDKGKGIADIARAMEPLYTTKPEEDRSGMGFSFMEAFMNDLIVESELGKGTTVKMKKIIGRTDF